MNSPQKSPDEVDRFHDHLDKCERCRERPFDLCSAGAVLIQAAAKQAADDILKCSVIK